MLCLLQVHLKAKADARKRQLQPIDFPKAEEPKGNAIVRDMAGVGMFETKGEKRRYLEKNLVRPVFRLNLHVCPAASVVDSLKPSEIVVSYSSLSRWPDPPPPPAKEESKLDLKSAKGKDKAAADRESRMEAMTTESSSMLDSKCVTHGSHDDGEQQHAGQ